MITVADLSSINTKKITKISYEASSSQSFGENIRAMYVLPLSPPTTPLSSSKEIEVSEIRKELLNEEKVSN